jgi:hypothetical protein
MSAIHFENRSFLNELKDLYSFKFRNSELLRDLFVEISGNKHVKLDKFL